MNKKNWGILDEQRLQKERRFKEKREREEKVLYIIDNWNKIKKGKTKKEKIKDCLADIFLLGLSLFLLIEFILIIILLPFGIIPHLPDMSIEGWWLTLTIVVLFLIYIAWR